MCTEAHTHLPKLHKETRHSVSELTECPPKFFPVIFYIFMTGDRVLYHLTDIIMILLSLIFHYLDPFWISTVKNCKPIHVSPPWHLSFWEKWPNLHPPLTCWSTTTCHFCICNDTNRKLEKNCQKVVKPQSSILCSQNKIQI